MPERPGQMVLDRVYTAKGKNSRIAARTTSSAGIAVVVRRDESPAIWVEVGRARQRLALRATATGLAHAFLNQPAEVKDSRAALPISARPPVPEMMA
jgi:hypothetical protein